MGRFIVYPAIAVAAILLHAAPAEAQANRTFVSGQGSDSNPCTLAAPCRSFTAALAATNAGGEVTMLDAAGFGSVTITKAISIVNDGGGEAGINDPAIGQDAITISAGAGDVVNLRGLTLNGLSPDGNGTGNRGIDFISGGALNIQNCLIRNFEFGVRVFPAASAAITISDTIISFVDEGIAIAPQSGATVIANLERITAIHSSDGILLGLAGSGIAEATIVDSAVVAGGDGVNVTGSATATLVNSRATQNNIGVFVDGGTVYMSQTTLAENAVGFNIAGGSIHTFGDNYIIDTNNSGSLTPIAAQ